MAQKDQSQKHMLLRYGACIAIAAVTWIVPPPGGLTEPGWHLLGVFAATIASFLIKPLSMGPMVLLGLVGLAITHTLPYKQVLAGFGDSTLWLVVAAFLIAGAVGETGFGRRIALTLVTWLGRSTLGLGYAVCAAELVLGPAVP